MEDILLCSQNPILIKNLYGILNDAGLGIDIADHHSLAITMVLKKRYGAIVIDAEQLGLSAEEAVRIVRSISPEISIIVVGKACNTDAAFTINAPVDLEEFKEVIDTISRFSKISQN